MITNYYQKLVNDLVLLIRRSCNTDAFGLMEKLKKR